MSQQILSIATLPEMLQVIQEMGDTEYLAKKEFDGKLRFNEGALNNGATGALATLTANTGKDMYLARAKINMETLTGVVVTAEVVLTVNGVTVETFGTRVGDNKVPIYEFVNIGHKVLAGQVIELNVNDSNTGVDIEGTLECFEEDTGSDPTILASSITVDSTVAGDTGDLVFIQEKVLSSNYFQVSGDINTINDTIEFIPAAGKTAFLIDAKIVITGHTTPATRINSSGTTTTKNQVQAELLIDSIVKDTTNIGMSSAAAISNFVSNASNANAEGFLGDGRFNVLGLSLIGDGIKKIEIENTLDAGTAFATMSGYIIDT